MTKRSAGWKFMENQDKYEHAEPWSIEHAKKLAKQKKKGLQFEFELIDMTPPPGDVIFSDVKIISGMQTGADIGAVKAGKYDLGLVTGGTMPSGFLAKDRNHPEYEQEFNATEHAKSTYPPRAMENVDKSDGTLAFRLKPSAGTDKTVGYARTGKWQKSLMKSEDGGHRPVLVLHNTENSDVNRDKIRDFIKRKGIRVLNVAGHTEEKSKGIEVAVRELLNAALREEPKSIVPLTSKLDKIEREALRKKQLIQEREVEYQEITDKLAEYNAAGDANKIRMKKRYIKQLLPFDLMSNEASKIYAAEFGKQLPLADNSTPTPAFEGSYKEFAKLSKNLDEQLVEKGKCD